MQTGPKKKKKIGVNTSAYKNGLVASTPYTGSRKKQYNYDFFRNSKFLVKKILTINTYL
jgi:hypothetical protein